MKPLQATILFPHGIPHSDVIKSYRGLLSLGQSDFKAVLRNAPFMLCIISHSTDNLADGWFVASHARSGV